MKTFVILPLIFIAVVTMAVFLYSFSYNLARGRLEEYQSYNTTTGQINETMYLLEDDSPKVRDAGQKLAYAFSETLAFGIKTGFSQELNDTLKQQLTSAAEEYYGLVAKEDPEVLGLLYKKIHNNSR